jgi:hypothetical protein
VFALIAVCGVLNNKEAVLGALIEANPVVEDLESSSIFPANAMNSPPLATKDSATVKSDSILNVFEEGIKGKEEFKFNVEVFELVIKIGARAEPPESVILKYMFAYAFVDNEELKAAGIAIVVAEEPEAPKVPVIGELLAPNTYVVKV